MTFRATTERKIPTRSRSLVYARALRESAVALWSSHAAHSYGIEGAELVVVDEFPPTLSALDAVAERALGLVGVRHPNLATVREVLTRDGARLVVSDFIEGERLDEVCARQRPPLGVSLRIVIDVLAALSALHDLDAPIVHGHVSAANVIVGADGVTRLVRAYLGAGEGVVDPRADLFATGALLEDLLPQDLPAWAVPIGDIVSMALANDVRERHACAADMARELQLLARSHVAPREQVVAFVDQAAGERIARRRTELAAPSQAERTQPMARVSLPESFVPVDRTRRMPLVAIPTAQPAGSTRKLPAHKPSPVRPPVRSSRNAATVAYRVPVERSPRWIALAVFLVLSAVGVAWVLRPWASTPVVPKATAAAPPDTTTSVAIPTGRSAEAPPPSVWPTSAKSSAASSRRPPDRSATF